jgi:hypothetical protein
MPTISGPLSFTVRLFGAAALDPEAYEDVEADRGATGQAALVVILSSLAAGIGARTPGSGSVWNILWISGVSLVAWAAWALVTYEIGSRLMPEPDTRVDVGQLLRTLGFASAPGLIRVLGVLPGIAVPVFAVSAVWMLAANVVAVRQALDYTSTARALAVCGLGWVLAIVLAVALGLFFGPAVS